MERGALWAVAFILAALALVVVEAALFLAWLAWRVVVWLVDAVLPEPP